MVQTVHPNGWRAQPGERFAHCVMLGVPFIVPNHNGHQHGVFECECGKVFAEVVNRVAIGHVSSCGCRRWKKGLLVPKDKLMVEPGNRFGNLLVIGHAFWLPSVKQHQQYVVCECDCGGISVKRASQLKNGQVQSCYPGCWQTMYDAGSRLEVARKNSRESRRKYTKSKRGRAWLKGYRAASWRCRATQMVSAAKGRAKRMGMLFDLDIDFVESRLKRGRCEVTGLSFDLTEARCPWTPSIDRIDSSRGYTRDNVQFVVWAYNVAKHNWKHEDVLTLARAILERAG